MSSQMDLGELENVAVMLILIIEVDVYVFVIRIHLISFVCVSH